MATMSQELFDTEKLSIKQVYENVARYCPQAVYHVQEYYNNTTNNTTTTNNNNTNNNNSTNKQGFLGGCLWSRMRKELSDRAVPCQFGVG